VTERSEKAAEIAFTVVLIAIVAGLVLLLFLENQDQRAVVAGFVGGVVSVLAVGVARWIGGSKNQPAESHGREARSDHRRVDRDRSGENPDHERDAEDDRRDQEEDVSERDAP
jgi:hypothetical protein